MTVLNKILFAIIGILTLGIFGLIIYNQIEMKKQQDVIQSQIVAQKTLVDGIVRSSSQYATKDDITNFAKNNDLNIKAVQDDLDSLKAQLVAVNVIHADSDTQNNSNLPSTSIGKKNPAPATTMSCASGTCPNQDPFGYQAAQQNLALNEDFGQLQVPIGSVGFSAWQKAPWSTQIMPRDYTVDTVVGKDANEKDYFYNKFNVNVGGKTYEIPIKTATTKQEYPAATFSWWNPRLLMGLDGGINISHVQGEVTPSLNVGIMSYGQYKTTPDWSIIELGLGYGIVNKTAEVVVTPVAYNLGKKLFSPFMNNTYIGPNVSIGTDGSIGVGVGLRIGF